MTFGFMMYRFFHDKTEGDEWLIIQHLPMGNYKAICTRENEYYKLGDVKANNHSLTNKKKYDGKPRNINRSGRKRT
jgi:hypothetical protein